MTLNINHHSQQIEHSGNDNLVLLSSIWNMNELRNEIVSTFSMYNAPQQRRYILCECACFSLSSKIQSTHFENVHMNFRNETQFQHETWPDAKTVCWLIFNGILCKIGKNEIWISWLILRFLANRMNTDTGFQQQCSTTQIEKHATNTARVFVCVYTNSNAFSFH